MTPSQLIAQLPTPPGHERESAQHARLFAASLAKHVYQARLESGAGLRDATDFKIWLEELGAAAARRGSR